MNQFLLTPTKVLLVIEQNLFGTFKFFNLKLEISKIKNHIYMFCQYFLVIFSVGWLIVEDESCVRFGCIRGRLMSSEVNLQQTICILKNCNVSVEAFSIFFLNQSKHHYKRDFHVQSNRTNLWTLSNINKDIFVVDILFTLPFGTCIHV